MSTETYTPAEIATTSAGGDTTMLDLLARAAGYTGVESRHQVQYDGTDEWFITVDESPTHDDLLSDIVAATVWAAPPLSAGALQVTADGVSVESISIVAGRANEDVTLSWPGVLPVDATTVTLDGHLLVV